jgi:hypothetical protein
MARMNHDLSQWAFNAQSDGATQNPGGVERSHENREPIHKYARQDSNL